MPVYEYTAINAKGKNVSGIIDADGETAAREKLRATNVFPATIKEVYSHKEKKNGQANSSVPLFSRIKPGEMANTTRQLSTLVGSGFPLTSAIYSLIPQAKSPALKKMLSRIKDAIEEGNSFAEALANFPDTFSPIYINMVRAGEASGTLEVVLERLADIQENQQAQKNQVLSILAYPAVMTLLGCGILFFLLTKIVPEFVKMFDDMNQVLPLITRIIIVASEFLGKYWLLLLIICLGLFFILRKLSHTEKGRYFIDNTVLLLPGIKTLAQKIIVARFSGTLGSLLENGIPMLTALAIVKNIVGNAIIADAIEEAAGKVEKGMSLGVSLEETDIFPHLSVQMIKVGEQSGDLEKMLNKTAQVYENEVKTTLAGLTSLLQPILVVCMGGIVFVIVLAIVLPIFEMNPLL
jgi:general secretion pathway protein F